MTKAKLYQLLKLLQEFSEETNGDTVYVQQLVNDALDLIEQEHA